MTFHSLLFHMITTLKQYIALHNSVILTMCDKKCDKMKTHLYLKQANRDGTRQVYVSISFQEQRVLKVLELVNYHKNQ